MNWFWFSRNATGAVCVLLLCTLELILNFVQIMKQKPLGCLPSSKPGLGNDEILLLIKSAPNLFHRRPLQMLQCYPTGILLQTNHLIFSVVGHGHAKYCICMSNFSVGRCRLYVILHRYCQGELFVTRHWRNTPVKSGMLISSSVTFGLCFLLYPWAEGVSIYENKGISVCLHYNNTWL